MWTAGRRWLFQGHHSWIWHLCLWGFFLTSIKCKRKICLQTCEENEINALSGVQWHILQQGAGLWNYSQPEFDGVTFGCFTDVSPVVPSAPRHPQPFCCADLPKLVDGLIFSPVGVVQDCLVQPLPWTFGQTETDFKILIFQIKIFAVGIITLSCLFS